ncbi:MAG: metabolite traffic protein EboE [Planctomycetales bacterium]|nr:metabolite traffic protein EboE [Planctomycetales bacterium]
MPVFRLGDRTVTLGYSANVRPGRTLADVRAHLRQDLPRVRAAVAPGRPFGVCLYLGAGALGEIAADPRAVDRLREDLAAGDLFLYAVNAFPLGDFHAPVVKEAAFRPDWRDPRRRDLTLQVARIATSLVPEGAEVVVSTVAGGFRPETAAAARQEIAEALAATAGDLARLAAETGRTIVLALEPEPWTTCETADEAAELLDGRVLAAAEDSGLADAARRHLGVNLDLCHAAVAFEDPIAAARMLARRGIRLGSVHATAALEVPGPVEGLGRLRRFAEPRYLHQAVAAAGGRAVARWRDLPELLAAGPSALAGANELRVHFHVPLDAPDVGGLPTTAPLTRDALRAILAEGLTARVIAETYTWGAGPLADPGDLPARLARELLWLVRELGLSPG